jgi:hypothetical protein
MWAEKKTEYVMGNGRKDYPNCTVAKDWTELCKAEFIKMKLNIEQRFPSK